MRIPYLTYKRLANGETAYYFNIPARLIPAGCLVKSQPLGTDYIKACQKALELYEKLKAYKKIEENIETKSFGFLWSLYIQSRFYIELSERTKKDYSRVYDLICQKENKSGQKLKDIPLDLFDSDSAYKLYQRFIESYRERWAKYCISILRLVYNFGMRKEILTRQNPFENMRIKNVRPKKRFIPAEHIQALIEKANELDLRNAALAIALNFYICQRPADVLKLRKKTFIKKTDITFLISFKIKPVPMSMCRCRLNCLMKFSTKPIILSAISMENRTMSMFLAISSKKSMMLAALIILSDFYAMPAALHTLRPASIHLP